MPVLNVRLMREPLNWAVIPLMLVIGGIAGTLLLELAGRSYASANKGGPAAE